MLKIDPVRPQGQRTLEHYIIFPLPASVHPVLAQPIARHLERAGHAPNLIVEAEGCQVINVAEHALVEEAGGLSINLVETCFGLRRARRPLIW